MQHSSANDAGIILPYEGVINALADSRKGLVRVYEHFCDLTLRFMGHGEPLTGEEVAELRLLVDICADENSDETDN